jgi:hypothetical protein
MHACLLMLALVAAAVNTGANMGVSCTPKYLGSKRSSAELGNAVSQAALQPCIIGLVSKTWTTTSALEEERTTMALSTSYPGTRFAKGQRAAVDRLEPLWKHFCGGFASVA